MSIDIDVDTDVLRGLDDIDGLVDVALGQRGDEQSLIGQYLNSGVELRTMLVAQDKELRELQEQFIDEHCSQVENLCGLYSELSECEKKLFSFEEQIFTFQKTLTDTAEDIVAMQQHTFQLVHRVANRKGVSEKISEVYSALKECDEFCQKVSSREVDKDYLLNLIKELESKRSFLANPDLKESAVNKEMSPKLEIAAQRAGDKVHRFLMKKIQALSEESTNVSLQQQALITVGQYAYSFLVEYNSPVALDLQGCYIRTMSEVYHRQARQVVRDFAEFLPFARGPSEAVVSHEVIGAIRNGKDCGTVNGAFYLPPPQVSGPKDRRSMSVSLSIEDRMRGIADRVRGKNMEMHKFAAAVRPADLHDVVDAVRSVDFTYSVASVDPVLAIPLTDSTCWVYRFAKLFAAIVNMVTLESRFISSFFFAHGESRNLEGEENLARQVLGRALDMIRQAFVGDLPSVRDRASAFGALRVVDQMKSFLCQSQNPIPLLISSTFLEASMNVLRRTVHELADSDKSSLNEIVRLGDLPQLNYSAPGNSLLAAIQQLPKLVSVLGPHDVTRQFALTAGSMHLFNTLRLPLSRIDGVTTVCFDESVSTSLRAQLATLVGIIDQLSKRHTVMSARYVFRIQNLAHLLLTWRALALKYQACDQPTSPPSPDDVQLTLVRGPHVAPASHVHDIQLQLRNDVIRYIGEESKVSGIADVLRIAQEAEAHFGSDFLSNRANKDSEPRKQPSGEMPELLQEPNLLSVLTQFNKCWKDQLNTIASSVKATFALSQELQRARSTTPDAAAIEESASTDFSNQVATFVLREYINTLLEANAQVHALVNACYGRSSALLSKLIGNQALEHEIQYLVTV